MSQLTPETEAEKFLAAIYQVYGTGNFTAKSIAEMVAIPDLIMRWALPDTLYQQATLPNLSYRIGHYLSDLVMVPRGMWILKKSEAKLRLTNREDPSHLYHLETVTVFINSPSHDTE